MARETQLFQMANMLSSHDPRELGMVLGATQEPQEGEAVANPMPLPGSTARVQLPLNYNISMNVLNDQLLSDNVLLRNEVNRLRRALQNSKVETAELYSEFGKLAEVWAKTLTEMNEIHEIQKQDYENTIGLLKKTNEQLLKENGEMKKVIEDLNKMKAEFEKQKRKLKLGQIGFQLDLLVSEYVFPGDDRESKRARYGAKLKSLKGKIAKMEDERMKENATKRIGDLDDEMFKDWFLGMVDDMKNCRVDAAHPDLGTYEEMQTIIKDEFNDDDDKRGDLLAVLEHLNQMYILLNREFGK